MSHAIYDFSEDAMGLASFIEQQMTDEEVSPVVYVVDEMGRQASHAVWAITTLSDGSKVAELRIAFADL